MYRRRLVKVNPREITVDESAATPTHWDSRAVEEDLTEYTSLFRFVSAVPTVRIQNGELVSTSGLPFLRAAQNAKPPLQEIVCAVEADEESFNKLGLEEVKPRDMLEQYPENEVYKKVQMLAFTRPLDPEEQQTVERSIGAFFFEMVAHPEYGGEYTSLGDFAWDKGGGRVTWSWERCDAGGTHSFHFFEVLKGLEDKTAPIRSLNGMAYSFKDFPDSF